jgi:hypothetical protein
MTWLLDFLIGIGEAIMPPWRHWSCGRKALVGAVAVLVALAVVVSIVVRVGQWVTG